MGHTCSLIRARLITHRDGMAERKRRSEQIAIAKLFHKKLNHRSILGGKQTGPRFSDAQLVKCVHAFNLLTDGSQSSVSFREFSLIKRNMPHAEKALLFSIFDQDRDGTLHVGEFVNGLCFFVNGSEAAKLSFIFNFFDQDESGFMSRESISTLVFYLNNRLLIIGSDQIRTTEELKQIVDEVCAVGFAMKNPEVLKRSNAATSFDLSSRAPGPTRLTTASVFPGLKLTESKNSAKV